MRRIFSFLLIMLMTSSVYAKEVVRLLTVGNSFAQNSTQYLAEIADAAGCRLILGNANIGAGRLSQHWEGVAAYEKNPARPDGKIYSGRSLKQLLEKEAWDVITLQQYSWQSHDVSTYRPYAEKLDRFIRQHAPSAEIMLHQTWAYRADDTGRINKDYSQEQMHADIRSAYHAIGKELGARIIPVGDAFARVRNHPDWNFVPDPDFDPALAEYPNCPDEQYSLNVGFVWRQKEGQWVLGFDTHHASPKGKYLGAAIFFETLFEKNVLGNLFIPEELTSEEVGFLQKIAHETVEASANITPAP